jgi:hypothetical protein
MLARLAILCVTLLCATSCTNTGRLETAGNFCRLYQPVPLSEGSGPAIEANEITYCVLCDPGCPDAIIDAWRERRP